MRYKKIGSAKVPAIGQGTGGIYNANIIKIGIECGLTLIDTAESYGNEEIIGQAVKGQRDKVFISTKFSPEHAGHDDIIKSCEASLRQLGTDYIDLYSAHYRNPCIPEEETALALSELRGDGKIRHIGVCNTFSPFIGDLKVDAVQVEYNLFDRSAEQMFSFCSENGVAVMAYSPVRDYHLLNPDSMIWLREIELERTLPQIILNWLISQPPVIALTSSNDIKHIRKNAEAGNFNLGQQDVDTIDKLFKADITNVPLTRIDITLSADRYPQTKEQAMTWNKWAVKPQDIDLRDFKSIKIEKSAYGDYEVKEGGLRYWAWVIQKNEPIPAIIKHRWNLDFKGNWE